MKSVHDILFIFEMANNHMGDLNHGLEIVNSFKKITSKFPHYNFGFKLQYRNLDTFIRPDMKKRTDIKYIKRFQETRLNEKDFDLLISHIKKNNFKTIATPFDEESVDLITRQKLDYIKIASCSFTDWPLLETIIQSKTKVIASTAGASITDIDNVASFFLNRKKDLILMYCVGEYPTPNKNLNLSQIDFLQKRYPNHSIGFSTHELPNELDIIKIVASKGVRVYEKHVGLPTKKYSINAYSSSPKQVLEWLNAFKKTNEILGNQKLRGKNKKENQSLSSLKRGIFSKKIIKKGEKINKNDIYFAFPPDNKQWNANDWSKYSNFFAIKKILKDKPINFQNTKRIETREKVLKIVKELKSFLTKSKITVPNGLDLEISHHYGIDDFRKYGLALLTIINREYCKKLLILLPNQTHPEQYHKKKEETFQILYGEIDLKLNGKKRKYKVGDVITIKQNIRHQFSSKIGSIIEEISSTHFKEDSYYVDEKINENKERKTFLKYWMKV